MALPIRASLGARENWGQPALHNAFFRYSVRSKRRHPLRPVYWYLITKGYKTYLLLSRNFPVYWPRHDRPTPAWETELLDRLGRERFGDRWVPARGGLRHDDCSGRLRPGVAGFRHARGVALLALGRVDEAIRDLDAVWEALEGADAPPLLEAERCFDLGTAWRRKGARDYARDYFERAQRAAPDPPGAERAAGERGHRQVSVRRGVLPAD